MVQIVHGPQTTQNHQQPVGGEKRGRSAAPSGSVQVHRLAQRSLPVLLEEEEGQHHGARNNVQEDRGVLPRCPLQKVI